MEYLYEMDLTFQTSSSCHSLLTAITCADLACVGGAYISVVTKRLCGGRDKNLLTSRSGTCIFFNVINETVTTTGVCTMYDTDALRV
jgi:hypothetical protein